MTNVCVIHIIAQITRKLGPPRLTLLHIRFMPWCDWILCFLCIIKGIWYGISGQRLPIWPYCL